MLINWPITPQMIHNLQNSVAVLAGTAEYDCSLFKIDEWVPQAVQNVKQLFLTLANDAYVGLPADRVFLLFNPRMTDVYHAISTAQKLKPEFFLFYYCGHGIPRSNTLLLPTFDTPEESLDNSAIRTDFLAAKLKTSKCKSLMILDSCFSERFLGSLAAVEQIAEAAAETFAEPEIVAFASASSSSLANSRHPDRENSLFTGELLNVFEVGVGGKPEILTAYDVFEAARAGVARHSGPKPCIRGDASVIPLARNRLNWKGMAVDRAFLGTFWDDTDDRFQIAFSDAIENAAERMVIVSMGFSLLGGHGHQLARRLRDKILQNADFRLYCLLADGENRALAARVAEELANIEGGYAPDWPEQFFRFCSDELYFGLSAAQKERLVVDQLTFFPMLTVIQLDSVFFARPYGEPSRQGRRSPWLMLDAESADTPWVSFLSQFVEYSLTHRRNYNLKKGGDREP